jgi:hypothetical protein
MYMKDKCIIQRINQTVYAYRIDLFMCVCFLAIENLVDVITIVEKEKT